MVEEKVTKEEFIEELEKELAYHQLDEGISYRQGTARYSLDIAKNVTDIYDLFCREQAYAIVTESLPELDQDRVRDVSKMLSVIVRDMHRKKNMSFELKELLKERKRNRKPLSVKRSENSRQENPHVSKGDLVKELEKELAYHLGGTIYRQKTTRYALQVANELPEPYALIERQDAYILVQDMLPELDEDRLQDVSKMLSVIVRDIVNQKTLPEETKKFAEEKMKNFKGITFK